MAQLQARETPWDMAIVGGGATGVGIALDAASRGYAVCLLEAHDFGKGTSSRSTKLIHGGVRYLQQGNVALVMEALKERGILRENAPHLVEELPFIVPNYAWWETPFYGIGMRVYDLLAGRFGFGGSRILSTGEVLEHIPTLDRDGLRGGVLYHDGQFDDARLLIDLAQTAEGQGAVLVNRAPVVGLVHGNGGFIEAVRYRDGDINGSERGRREGGDGVEGGERTLRARCVINATGAFCDGLRRMDEPGAAPIIAPSQGVHLVLPREFLPGNAAIMVPRTSDGRVLFAIPWHGHTLVGTTDTPIAEALLEPEAKEEEIAFILETAARYLSKRPGRRDVLSVFVGIRPLVRAAAAEHTAVLSREHTIQVSQSGLLTIAGGKWTTYRKMAEDAVDHAATLAGLEERPCVTRSLKIHGHRADARALGALWFYGSAAEGVLRLIEERAELGARLHPSLPIVGAQVVWAAREEMARGVEDVLSRRTRALVLNARAAMAMAPAVARLLAEELGRDELWQHAEVERFRTLAAMYVLP
jgi:glycerol-3-phosphate dehydrogenase